ncbi:hypothetical protein ACOSQ4_009469 [Xanthoceras sorbifolium]
MEKGPRKTVVGNSVVYNNHERIGSRERRLCGVLYKCEHVYHRYFINKWLTKSKHCPHCRCYVIEMGLLGLAVSNPNLSQIRIRLFLIQYCPNPVYQTHPYGFIGNG